MPLTLEEQLDRLKERGLRWQDREQARFHLKHLSYSRLSGYWDPCVLQDTNTDPRCFGPDTQFENVLNLYDFDRELRLLIMDAVERVEISIRNSWAYHLSERHGDHAHRNSRVFKPRQRKNNKYTLWDHGEQLKRLQEACGKSKEYAIEHHRNRGHGCHLPIWAVAEAMGLKDLSLWCKNLRDSGNRNQIAQEYHMDGISFCSFLHHLSYVRNICAHHGHLWNRRVAVTLRLPRNPGGCIYREKLSKSPGREQDCHNLIYNTLTTLAWLMDQVNSGRGWKQRLKELLTNHQIEVSSMGFPPDYALLPVWRKEEASSSGRAHGNRVQGK